MVDEKQLLGGLASCVKPILGIDSELLKEKIEQLKQGDGECWAIGETIERIKILRGALNDPSILEELAEKWEKGL